MCSFVYCGTEVKRDATNTKVKIEASFLGRPLSEIRPLFGSWIENLKELNQQFLNADPFPYVVIENFFSQEVYEEILKVFPKPIGPHWHRYYNPLEIKNALDKMDQLPPLLKDLIHVLNEESFIDLLRSISGIGNLERDPYLHGAGLHSHTCGGKLGMHLDYSIHPVTGMERRLNLIAFCTESWQEEWNGNLEFWDDEMKEHRGGAYPMPNRAVLFRTTDISYHGSPKVMKCPKDHYRQSIAIYYMSEPREECPVREKATYFPRPEELANKKWMELREIRKYRRITHEDLERIWPTWEKDLLENL